MTETEPEIFQKQSFLLADCGHTNTTVVLFDAVEGVYRFIAKATVATTVVEPWHDVSVGVRQAIEQISAVTGRALMREEGALISPMQDNGSGIDIFAVTVSAAAPLETLLVGLFDEVSLASARRALKHTYAHEVDRFSLADTRSEHERVSDLIHHQPDLVFIVGGTDGGADSRLLEMVEAADIGIALSEEKPRVVFSGNQILQEKVQALIGFDAEVQMTGNVRPDLHQESMDEAAAALSNLYEDLKIDGLLGIDEVNEWSSFAPVPTAKAAVIATQQIAALEDGMVLSVDVGSNNVHFVAATGSEYKMAIRTDLGVGRPLKNLLDFVEPRRILRWLPYEMDEADVVGFLYNKSLFPQTFAVTKKEVQLEHAILRELVRQTAVDASISWGWTQKQEWLQDVFLPEIKSIVVRGGSFANMNRLGQVPFVLLDALQPTGIFSLKLDRYGLLPGLGIAGSFEPLVTVQALQNEALLDLGYVIAPSGVGKLGRNMKVVDVLVEGENGQQLEDVVTFGSLDVFSVGVGEMAQVTIQPTRNFDVGAGLGQPVQFSCKMGALGLIIDARGRPLYLPEDDEARQSIIHQWSRDLGV